ncbi:MAG: hypothetical protein WCJ13_00380 [Coriobacteriia bacterium]
MPDDAVFCATCGGPLASAPPPLLGGAPPPPAPPGSQPVAPPPMPAQAAAAPPSTRSSGSKTGLVIGIVVGVVVLLLLCGIGWVFFARALVPKSGTDFSQLPASVGSVTASGSVSASETTVAAAAAATTPEPPPIVAPTAPAAEPAPEPAPTVSLTKSSAIDLVMTYLQDAMNGDSAKAKAVTTARFRAEKTSDYYSLAANDLKEFGMVDTQKGEGGYLVYVKEKWSEGTWTNWYLVVKKDGKLVIDNIGTE